MNPHFRPLARAIVAVGICLVLTFILATRLTLDATVTIEQKHVGVAVLVFGCICTFVLTICSVIQAKRYGAFKS